MNGMTWKLSNRPAMLHHNGRLANPFDPFTLAMKEITNKKKKTEDDCLALYWLEWCGSLYSNKLFKPSEAHDAIVSPVVPESNLLSFINDGARHSRQGQDVWRGVQIASGDAPLLDTGWPEGKKLSEIYAAREFVDIRSVVNPSTGGRTMRCRPIFRTWSCTFTVMFDPEMVSRKDLISWINRAAKYNGLCDGKPLFGRCDAEIVGEEAQSDAA